MAQWAISARDRNEGGGGGIKEASDMFVLAIWGMMQSRLRGSESSDEPVGLALTSRLGHGPEGRSTVDHCGRGGGGGGDCVERTSTREDKEWWVHNGQHNAGVDIRARS